MYIRSREWDSQSREWDPESRKWNPESREWDLESREWNPKSKDLLDYLIRGELVAEGEVITSSYSLSHKVASLSEFKS